MMFIFKGDKVKPSEFALRPYWDYYQRCGEYRAKQNAKLSLDEKTAVRGTVTEVHKWGVTVALDSGGTCDSVLAYWERV